MIGLGDGLAFNYIVSQFFPLQFSMCKGGGDEANN
jgi:hypothetical protein